MGLRHALTLALSLAALGAAPPRGLSTRDAVAIVRQYVNAWQVELAAVVAEERYEQTRSIWSGIGRSQFWREAQTRSMRSDVLLLRAPAQEAWLTFRDVFEVDGQAVRDREQRFDALFRAPSAQLATDARRIADESARFNLGTTLRNVNSPTTALVFLQPPYVETVTWSVDSDATRNGMRVWSLQFTQNRPPYAVSGQEGRPVKASGWLWIEPGYGRILETEVLLQGRSASSRVNTRYAAMASGKVFVPIAMKDEYEMPRRERAAGDAKYMNHRLFQTGGRIIGPASR